MNILYKCPKCGNWDTKDYGPKYEIDGMVMCQNCLDEKLEEHYNVLYDIPTFIESKEVDDETYFEEAEEKR